MEAFYTQIEFCMLSFGWFPGVWILYADVSKHSFRNVRT